MTSYGQEFSSSEYETRTINIYIEKWIPKLQRDNMNNYIASRNVVREQENGDVNQASIQLIDFVSEQVSGEGLPTPILPSSNWKENGQNTVEDREQYTVPKDEGERMAEVQENSLKKTPLNETMIES